ncbi:MAG: signal recognition particle-docking protein FtsY [Deltaproteobacteria bacterium]|nr:signal recognition particle-docking protein FtsY [Deltaproteobacteria bacterium]
MSPTLIIVIAVVAAVLGLGFALLRKRPESLPAETPKPKPKTLEKSAPDAQAATDEVSAPAPEADAQAQADAQADAQAQADVQAQADAQADADAQVQADAEAPARKAPSAEEVAALKKGLASTRGGFISRLARLFGGKREIDPALLDEVEEVLIGADIGVHTTQRILDSLREKLAKNELADADAVWAAIQAEAEGILSQSRPSPAKHPAPTVILVVGVNGVGKTTTIGKLTKRFTGEGKKVLLAAGDTFRAAAVLQLEVWGRRTGAEVVKGKDRADPGSVIFDAIKRGQDEGYDLVIADTAGRLHTKTPLMDELQKVGRTVEKALGRPADEILLVLDATTGQNAIQQTELFKQALPLSGIVLTKLDGSAKGGVVLGIMDQHGLPIHYLGVGEKVEDLREFDAPSFASALFERPEEPPEAG